MSRLSTISDEMTQAGRVLGTAAYMRPEQARGLPVDSRFDLFCFGIVLYEMVTGNRPFRGSTVIDTLTAILREQPDSPLEINPEAPAEPERIIRKHLEKESGERHQDTRDLVLDLKRLKRDTDSQPLRMAGPSRSDAAGMLKRGLGGRALIVSAILAGLAAMAAAAWSLLRQGKGAREMSAAFQGVKLRRLAGISDLKIAALSSDGRFLAYVTAKDGKYGLRVRQVSTCGDVRILPPQPVPTRGLTFSPGGEYLFAQTRTRTTPSTTSSPGSRRSGRGTHWHEAMGFEQLHAEGRPAIRWIDRRENCELMLPYRWAPPGGALTCIGELNGASNLWFQPIAGVEARPITNFRSIGHGRLVAW